MSLFKSSIALLCAASLATSAAAATEACVSKQVVADMSVVLLPGVIESGGERCSAHLPETAFLRQPASKQFVATLKAAGGQRLGSAVQAIRSLRNLKASGGVEDQVVIQMMSQEVGGALFKSVDRETCHNIDALFEAISAMTPDQAGRFITALFALSSVKEPSICKS